MDGVCVKAKITALLMSQHWCYVSHKKGPSVVISSAYNTKNEKELRPVQGKPPKNHTIESSPIFGNNNDFSSRICE